MSRPLQRFWRAIESVPGLAAVPSEWRALLGDEYEFVRHYLVATNGLARSVQASAPGRHCIHEVHRHKGEFLAVCPDGCSPAMLSRDDLVIHRLDTARLGREVAAAFALEALPAEPVPNVAGVLRIGDYVPLSGFRFPVCLAFAGEPDVLRQVVDGLTGRGEPFVLMAPTRSACRQATVDLVKRAKSCFLPLAELLGQGDGRLALLDGVAAESVLAEFCAVHVSQTKGSDGMVFFPTPAGTRWEHVVIRIIDGETISVKVKGVAGRYLFSEVGMSDGRSKKPTKQWELLRDFADEHGLIDWESRKAGREKQKQRENLAKDLRRFFRLDEDPFVLEGNGWRARFSIEHA